MNKKPTISDAELEVIEILWQSPVPLSAFEIRHQLNEKNQWERTTVLTLIRRLVEKEWIYQEKRDIYYYTAAIDKKEYVKGETREFVNKLYRGKSKDLVAALFQDRSLSVADIEELKDYFNQ